MQNKTLVVVGGGAAGFFCAINAASMNPLLNVLLLEKTSKLLSKVRVSGGGRCNVTHDCRDITEMSNRYPRGKNFVKKAFHGFFTTDTIAWFGQRGVQLKTESDGRMFPVTNSSETIVNCLLKEAFDHGVQIMMNTVVAKITREQDGFLLALGGGGTPAEIHTDYLCLATGGYPKEVQYSWFSDFGHTIVKPVPSLFTFNAPKHSITGLMGVSVPEAEIRIPAMKYKERGPLLITHWGLSGPVVLRSSAWCAREMDSLGYDVRIMINWCSAYNENSLRAHLLSYRINNGPAKVKLRSPIAIAQRLWEYLASESGVADQKWADLSSVILNKLVKNLTSYEMDIKGKTTFKEEFVTAGGIQLSEVDPNSMESRKVPHLYFAGEVLDVDGITGGYNFQHAWTSGYNAALDIAGKSLN